MECSFRIVFKNVALTAFLTLLIVTLIAVPIIIAYQLSPLIQNTEIGKNRTLLHNFKIILFFSSSLDPCKSSRTLTFDDIGTNSF